MTLKAQAFSQIISFTRTSAATFVNSAGNIALTPASVNLLTFSQEFDNAAWVKTSASVSANSFVAPDSTTGADTITASGANGTALQSYTASATPYTFSIWLRRLTGSGNVQLTVDGTTYVTVAVTSDWTRFSTTLTPSAGTRSAGIRIVTSADAVYAWGAQLEAGSSPSAYVRNFGGLFPPRIDYDPVTLLPRGLLVEEQRTNLFVRSEEFDNAAWVKNAASVTANSATSPDGTVDADLLVPNATSNVHGVYSTATFGAGAFTLSIYAKAAGYPRLGIRSYDSAAYVMFATFDLSSGTVVNATGGTASIRPAGNGWYRCIVTAASAINLGAVIGTWFESLPAGVSVQQPFTGDGTSGTLLWGAQLEAGTFATSYIPTVASQVTRNADTPVAQAPMFAPWYNVTEGTIFCEYSSFAASANATKHFATVSDGSSNNRVLGYVSNAGSPFLIVADSGAVQASAANGAVADNAVVRTAIAYRANDFAIVSNGGAAATDTSGTVPTAVTQLGIGISPTGGSPINGHIRSLRYYPTRISNAQLQAMTAL